MVGKIFKTPYLLNPKDAVSQTIFSQFRLAQMTFICSECKDISMPLKSNGDQGRSFCETSEWPLRLPRSPSHGQATLHITMLNKGKSLLFQVILYSIDIFVLTSLPSPLFPSVTQRGVCGIWPLSKALKHVISHDHGIEIKLTINIILPRGRGQFMRLLRCVWVTSRVVTVHDVVGINNLTAINFICSLFCITNDGIHYTILVISSYFHS